MKRNSIYKCEKCGNMVEVQHVGGGTLTCCNQAMTLLVESSADHTTEKHVPFVEKTKNGYRVKVGENQAHPMLEAHYILWIELQTANKVYRTYLKPGDAPEASFDIGHEEIITGAREYCNLHGLWSN